MKDNDTGEAPYEGAPYINKDNGITGTMPFTGVEGTVLEDFEKNADSYHIAAQMYVAERGVRFMLWTATPPPEKPYAILNPGRLDIYANKSNKISEVFDLEDTTAAQKIVDALGLLEFIPETNRHAQIIVCASPGMQAQLKEPIEDTVQKLRKKYKIKD